MSTTTHPSSPLVPAGPLTLLLDDDVLIHMTWRMAAKQAGARLEVFDSPEALLARLAELASGSADPVTPDSTANRDVRVYVDSKLRGGVLGENVARQVVELGFPAVYITTGYPPARFAHVTWVRGVIGKDPPFFGSGDGSR